MGPGLTWYYHHCSERNQAWIQASWTSFSPSKTEISNPPQINPSTSTPKIKNPEAEIWKIKGGRMKWRCFKEKKWKWPQIQTLSPLPKRRWGGERKQSWGFWEIKYFLKGKKSFASLLSSTFHWARMHLMNPRRHLPNTLSFINAPLILTSPFNPYSNSDNYRQDPLWFS